MKTRAKKPNRVSLVAGSTEDRYARMQAYVQKTKPQFEAAMQTARRLGVTATGVLAGRASRSTSR